MSQPGDNLVAQIQEGEEQCKPNDECPYELRLYVAGQTARSMEAFSNLKKYVKSI